MYIKNGIAYAGEQTQPLKISGVRPLEDYKLWVRFSNGEVKIFDFSKELNSPAFSPLKDKAIFNSVSIEDVYKRQVQVIEIELLFHVSNFVCIGLFVHDDSF